MKTTTRRAERILRWLTGTAILLAVASAHAAVTDPYTAHFDVSRGSLALGTSRFSLKPTNHNGCYVLSGEADPNFVARLFTGKVTEESRFCIDSNGVLHPQYYRHNIAGNKKKSYTLDFHWAQHQVVYTSGTGRRKTMPLGKRDYDPLSIQIVVRRWLAASDAPAQLGTATFPIVDADEIKHYRLQVANAGQLKTADGSFDTLLVRRVGDKHKIRFWLARRDDWLPVRIENQKGDKESFRMNLSSLQRPGT